MKCVAEGMKSLSIEFDCILSSPYLRARQTAEMVRDVYKSHEEIKYSESLAADRSCQGFINELKEQKFKASKLLIVGHEPFLSEFISTALTGDQCMSMELKKGGICKLEWDLKNKNKPAVLRWLLTPKQLRAVAK